MDNKTGEIKAMVGGYSFQKSKFNRAIQALRQTGSTFKPIIYTAALENGFSPATIIQDEPFSYYDEWTGSSGNRTITRAISWDRLTLRRGLELSRNVVTARILQAITPEVGVRYAKKFGITSDLKPYMSLSLGAFEVTLKEMVEAFTVFANYGVRVNSYFIRSIRDLNNNIIEENFPERKQVIEKETAFIMNYLLQGVVRSGTGWRARALPAPIGGKTGTTNDFTDAWFIGFTPTPDRRRLGRLRPEKKPGQRGDRLRGGLADLRRFMEKYLTKYPETGKVPPSFRRLYDRHRQVHRQVGHPRLPLSFQRSLPAGHGTPGILQRRGAPEDFQLFQDGRRKLGRLSRVCPRPPVLFLDQEIPQQPFPLAS